MRNVLSKINIFNLLVCRLILKFSRDRLISQFDCNNINTNEEKSREKKITKKKSVKNNTTIKIMQINNIFSTNILMFCDSDSESKSSILLFFVKSKNIKN